MQRSAIFAGLAGATWVATACGGSPPPPPPKPAEPPVLPTKRTPAVPVDDEVEDGVGVTSSRGHMDPAAIEAGIAPHKDALGACYTERVGRRKWLGGHVVVKWDIARGGDVNEVKLAESDLGAWEIEKCVLEIARSAAFAKPTGGDADFTLPLEFTAKGRVATWDEDASLRAVGGQLTKLDDCSKAKGVKRAPRGVVVTVYVGPQGKAQSVGFSSATSVVDDAWAECADKAARGWRLPDPRGGIAKLAVKYK